jgi:hypothetical protein
VALRSVKFTVTGELDVARLMGQPTENRAGFAEIELVADIDSDASVEELEEMLQLVELRCPVSDNLSHPTPLVIRLAASEWSLRADPERTASVTSCSAIKPNDLAAEPRVDH